MADEATRGRFMRGGTSARAGAARAISLITAAVVLAIVIGILLVVLEANPSNDIVDFFTSIAEFLVGPFEDLFTLKDRKGEIAVNWGLAAVVYLIIGRLIAGLVAP